MVVTILAPSASALNRAAFQATLMGLEFTPMPGNIFDLTVANLDKANYLTNFIDGEILAVADKVLIDPQEVY